MYVDKQKLENLNPDQIIQQLVRKGASLPCSRCGAKQFQVVGWSHIGIVQDNGVFGVGEAPVSTVVVACSNCGNMSQHSIGILLEKNKFLEKVANRLMQGGTE